LLINRLPLHPSRECITLQNIGRLVAPYRIFRRDQFIGEISSLGYALVDSWVDPHPQHHCWIPFYPEFTVPAYTGLYFVREM
jgi:putative methyltransferase (TIGR04325 family)